MVVWAAWGLIVGAIIFWLDQDLIAAALWMLVGIATGTCALRVLGRFSTPVFEWFHNFASDSQREQRIIELLIEEKADSEELNCLLQKEAVGMMAIGPPACGLFHGALLGGIGGALCGLDPTLKITSSRGALYGVILGMMGISFLAATVFAIMMPADKSQSFTTRMAQRALMLVSPIFVFPVVWYCVKWMFKRRPANPA